jgi:cysteine desulfurase/selenocysteine lyase
MPTDWHQIRAEFPALSNWTFLNTATFGQIPRRAVEAIHRHLARRDEFACSDFLGWFDDADGIRGLIARLIHCSPEDIAFIPNASTAFSLLLGGMDWKPGDQIVTLQDEFPNHYYYPSYLNRRGVKFIETPYERFFDSVSPRTRLVALTTVNYSTGFRPPLAEISKFLRERGVLLYVDGTQSVGALPFDAEAIRPDLLAVHGYKWLLAPNGAGFMYVSPELRARLEPSIIGWRSHYDWRNHDYLHHGAPVFKTEAEKYEGGMLTFPVIYAMGASIEMMLEIGPTVIEERVMELAGQVRAILRRAGAVLLSDQCPHYESPIVAARFRDPSAMARELKARRVLVAARHGNLRVSPHFYNDSSDLARFEEALAEVNNNKPVPSNPATVSAPPR